MVPTNKPLKRDAMKLATPDVPKSPCVVEVRIPPFTKPGAIYPVKSKSYSSKKKPRLSNTISFQTLRVAGSRSRRADIPALSTSESSPGTLVSLAPKDEAPSIVVMVVSV
jgi:hypothetical protein